MIAPILTEGPLTIEGVTVYNPLPAHYFVDLDKECVIPIGGEIDPFDVEDMTNGIDRVINAGRLPNGVHWGITDRSEYGFANIYIDTLEVTEDTLRQLITAKVITVI